MTKIVKHKIDNDLNNQPNNIVKTNYKVAKLGRSFKLCLNGKQVAKLSQWLGCIRKIKNIKIAEVNSHNQKLLSHTQRDLFKKFKENHPELKDNENPYRYIYPEQGYAFAKELIINFVGPLNKNQYEDIYINNKHYLERVPSELYRNSMKDLMEGNKKYIKDYFDNKILYHNKRKELTFIKKSDDRDSLFISSSDNLFKFIEDKLYIGKNIEKSLVIEQELKCLNRQFKLIKEFINNPDKYFKLLAEIENKVNNKDLIKKPKEKDLQIKSKNKRNKSTKKLSKKEIELINFIKDLSEDKLDNLIKELEDKIITLAYKLNKDLSYVGELQFNKSKVNKSYKKINFNTIKGIRIKKLKDNFYVSFSFDYANEYNPNLFEISNKDKNTHKEEIINKEQLALYLKELTDKYGKQKALDYLVGKILGIDRGINERLTLSVNNVPDKSLGENSYLENNSNLNEIENLEDKYLSQFLSYEPEIKAYIEKLKKQIEYHNKQLKRRTVNSRGYNKSKQRYLKLHGKIANIKRDINHKVTNHIISSYSQQIIALEKLNIKGMTKRAIPKVDIKKSLDSKFNIKHGLDELKLTQIVNSLEEFYKSNVNKVKYKDIVGDYKLDFMKNKASAKSGLNESILTQNWGQFGLFIEYKGNLNGKIIVEVDPKYTSQECSVCGYINVGNRVKSKFCCLKCNHKEHADSNASKVIAGRVYKELLKYAEELMSKKDKTKDKNSDNYSKKENSNKFNAPLDMGIVEADGNEIDYKGSYPLKSVKVCNK